MTPNDIQGRGSLEVCKAFTFEAAHYFNHRPDGHPNARIHGHSFRVEVVVEGQPDPRSGWIVDLGALAGDLDRLRDTLDHRLLNEIEGLETPALESLAMWIAGRLLDNYPRLRSVTVSRPTCFESATFRLDTEQIWP
ncbi:MAG: 6-pyruvoyl tetrahydropterin synthase family protein [Alphaproteobacteria bacterium]